MSSRRASGIIYVFIVLMSLLLRVSSALGVYEIVGADGDVWFTLVVQVLIFGVLGFFGYYFFRTRPSGINVKIQANEFGFKKISARTFGLTFVIAIGMVLLSGIISFVWQSVLSIIGFKRAPSKTDYSSVAVLFSELFFTALLPGIFEELSHRGLLYAGYRETGYRFVIVSALLFSLMHQNIVQTGYTFFDGVIIALAMYYTGSVWPGVFIHIFNNAVSIIQGFAAQNGGILEFINIIRNWFYSSLGGIFTYTLICALFIIVMYFAFKRMREDGVKNGVIERQLFSSGIEGALPLHKDAFFLSAVVIGAAATIFTLAWGIIK